jgi:hypothetical protein
MSALNACANGEIVTVATARAVLGTTPAQVAAAALHRPADLTHHQIRTMEALGYPLRWIAAESGVSVDHIGKIRPGRQTSLPIADAIATLAARVADTPAGPENGVPWPVAQQARGRAKAAGWYPPAFYDEDRQLIVRAIPDHPWSLLDERAAIIVHGAYLGGQGRPSAEVARTLGASKAMVQKDCKQVWGYAYTDACAFDPIASRPRILEVSRIFHDWEDGQIGPVTAALMLGASFKRPGAGQSDHPELLAWHAAQAAADDTARAA